MKTYYVLVKATVDSNLSRDQLKNVNSSWLCGKEWMKKFLSLMGKLRVLKLLIIKKQVQNRFVLSVGILLPLTNWGGNIFAQILPVQKEILTMKTHLT